MTSSDNGKLMATAAGAAVAGAALAVVAMKLTEKSRPGDSRLGDTPRVSYLRNEHDEFEKPSLHRTSSETLLFPHNHEEKMRRRIATRFTIEEENNTPRQSVTVRVPATSANVGPGCTSSCCCTCVLGRRSNLILTHTCCYFGLELLFLV
jgi:hypothetical protein